LLFNEKTQENLGKIYPFEDLLSLNQQIMSLRSAYIDQSNGLQDCRAFVENPTVSTIGPVLEKNMQEILSDLN
jgi:hypothetical protein